MHRPTEGVFEQGSHVLEYWLANSEGFTVGQRPPKRRVAAVVIDPDTRRARSLVVRRGRRGTQLVSASAITAVDPKRRVLYTAPRRRVAAVGSQTRSGIVRLQPVAAAAGTHSRAAAQKSAALTRSGFERLRPVAIAGVQKSAVLAAECARRLAAITAAAGDRLRPLAAAYAHNAVTIAQLYARAARHGLVAARSRVLER